MFNIPGLWRNSDVSVHDLLPKHPDTKQKPLSCTDLLLQGRSIKSVTNEELVEIIKGQDYTNVTWSIISDEFNSRLMNPELRGES